MNIWVDADACPLVIKEILYKAAERTQSPTTFVANRPLRIPQSSYLKFILVTQGPDIADKEIVNRLDSGELVITSDIPLAAKAVDKGAYALNPRGELYTHENVHERLSTRDFMDDLRASGIETGGPSSLNKRDVQHFANSLDQFLRKHCK